LTSGSNTFAGKVLKPITNRKTGYVYVKLTKQGKVHKKQLHILVAQLFLPEPKVEGLIVDHIDGHKDNPKATNLEWITRSENSKRAIKLGLQKLCYGEDNGATKISFSKITELRADYETGNFLQRELAEKYNLSLIYVCNIINKKFRVEK
jgi:hypothetical protein